MQNCMFESRNRKYGQEPYQVCSSPWHLSSSFQQLKTAMYHLFAWVLRLCTTERKDGSNERVGKLLATPRSPACILRLTHQWAYSLLVLTEFLPCQTPAHSPQISGSSPSQSNGFLESSGRRGHAFSKPSQTSTLLYVTFAFEVDEGGRVKKPAPVDVLSHG